MNPTRTSPAIESCRAGILRVANSFRIGCDAQGNEAFVVLIDEIASLFERELPPERAERITSLFPAIIAAQTRGDTITVADLLEYEIGPLIASTS
jgi:hypothetical protein